MVSEQALPRAPKSAERIDGAMIAGGVMTGGSAAAVSDSGDCLCDEDCMYCFGVELMAVTPLWPMLWSRRHIIACSSCEHSQLPRRFSSGFGRQRLLASLGVLSPAIIDSAYHVFFRAPRHCVFPHHEAALTARRRGWFMSLRGVRLPRCHAQGSKSRNKVYLSWNHRKRFDEALSGRACCASQI